jgi:cation:H+ antiporter
MDFWLYLASFFLIGKGADLVVSSVVKLAHRLKISAFSLSFFVLGILTSLPEITVGFNSVMRGTPEVFVGNLLGATLTIFIFVIPLLAILGNGLSLKHELDERHLLMVLFVIILPVIFLLDSHLEWWDAVLLIGGYGFLFFFLERRYSLLNSEKTVLANGLYFQDWLKVAIGAGMVMVSSYWLVEKTVEFAHLFGVSPFIISFAVVGLGTNLPEIALVLRTVLSRQKEVAFGDFLGSAVANSVIMGALAIFNRGGVVIPVNFPVESLFIFAGVGWFYVFYRSGRMISRWEGAVLLGFYALFLSTQWFLGR